MNETPKTKRGWRILRRILIGLAILATLISAFYTEEDWRGKRAWENYKHEWEAKGEKFDWQSFVPPSVPDDQNFFTAPIFTNMLNGKAVMNPYTMAAVQMSWPKNDEVGYLGGEGKTRITDLKTWQASYRNPTNASLVREFPIAPQAQMPTKDVLLALSKFDSAVEELRQASQRPYSNVPLNYQDGFNSALKLNSYFMAIKRCTQLLQLRANAELADGQSAKALDDVKLLLYLNNSLRTSPFLISHLVRAAIVPYELQAIWEGLAEHKWSDEQLISLDAELSRLDFLADYEFVMRGERAFAIASFENQRRTHEVIMPLENDGVVTNKIPLMPDAYFYQNELAIAQMQQQWLLPLIDTNARTVLPESLRRANAAFPAENKHFSPYKAQALMLYPALGNMVKKFAAIQSSIDLARVACALERYRLAHGVYPETLGTLSPKFIEKLPHDIINGRPLHYGRSGDGQFILYSVGWNETDDGGEVVLKKGGSVDQEQGDWVWQYPRK
jgi:tetratricopeptide (TPR) repeat protein